MLSWPAFVQRMGGRAKALKNLSDEERARFTSKARRSGVENCDPALPPPSPSKKKRKQKSVFIELEAEADGDGGGSEDEDEDENMDAADHDFICEDSSSQENSAALADAELYSQAPEERRSVQFETEAVSIIM